MSSRSPSKSSRRRVGADPDRLVETRLPIRRTRLPPYQLHSCPDTMSEDLPSPPPPFAGVLRQEPPLPPFAGIMHQEPCIPPQPQHDENSGSESEVELDSPPHLKIITVTEDVIQDPNSPTSPHCSPSCIDINPSLCRRLRASDARLYKISRFSQYQVDDSEDIKRALYQLRRGGPLLAVIKISKKYDKFYNTGRIYKFDPNTAVMNNNGTLMTHALSMVSFVLEAKVPCLECQDSHGQHFGKSGFLMVDVSDRTL
ncbi:hypothetical protein ACP4OV_009653 [Aristida adscensionis]